MYPLESRLPRRRASLSVRFRASRRRGVFSTSVGSRVGSMAVLMLCRNPVPDIPVMAGLGWAGLAQGAAEVKVKQSSE